MFSLRCNRVHEVLGAGFQATTLQVADRRARRGGESAQDLRDGAGAHQAEVAELFGTALKGFLIAASGAFDSVKPGERQVEVQLIWIASYKI